MVLAKLWYLKLCFSRTNQTLLALEYHSITKYHSIASKLQFFLQSFQTELPNRALLSLMALDENILAHNFYINSPVVQVKCLFSALDLKLSGHELGYSFIPLHNIDIVVTYTTCMDYHTVPLFVL